MKRNIKCAISLLVCFALVAAFLPTFLGVAQAVESTYEPVFYEGFEGIEDVTASGWKLIGAGYGEYEIREEDGNHYYYMFNNQSLQQGIGISTESIDFSGNAGHTKVRISMKVKGGGDFPGAMQTTFKVFNADATWINNNISGNSYAYNNNFNNVTWEDWTKVEIVKDIVLPESVAGTDVDANGATASLLLNQRWSATGPLCLDDITIEYVHSYTLGRDSGVAAPEGTYIKCDYCDQLAKDDPTFSGITTKLPSYILVKEDFERTPVGEKKIPSTWTLVNGVGSYGVAEDGDNSYYYANNNHINTPTGMKIALNLGQSNGHTQVALSMDVKGGGDFPGVLQSSFMVYNAAGDWINNNTTSKSYAYNNNYNNASWEDWTRITIVKDIVLPDTVAGVEDRNGATATWQMVQRWNATAALYVDNILVEYVHTYDLGLDSGVAAPGGTYIKCDHCDALKINDATQTEDFIIPGGTVEPTDPTDPEPTDPTDPEPTDPTDPEPTDPTDPEPTDPTDPEPTDPEVTDPTEPEPTEPVTPTGDHTALTLMLVVMALSCVALVVTKVKFGYRK